MKIVKTVITGVGSRAKELILTTSLTNNEILEIVRKEHPLRKTTYACIAWYRNDLKKNPPEVPEKTLNDFYQERDDLYEQLEALENTIQEMEKAQEPVEPETPGETSQEEETQEEEVVVE